MFNGGKWEDENVIFRKYELIGDRVREQVANMVLKLPISITPTQITIVNFILGILSAISFALSNLLFGAILYYISDVLDGVDGIIARRRDMSTSYGAYLDSCLDRYVDMAIILGICVYLSRIEYIWIVGIFAIIGNFMISYTTHRAEALGKVVLSPLIPWHRRTRMHVVVVGAILNQLFFALIILALVGNLNALWRMMPWMLKDFNSVDERTKKFLPKTSLRKFQADKSAIKRE
ncbi:MAG: CDP-alcohol phosphatidyltransferase family protein [Candidatus Hydrothermarchaeales archaeon]